ncbi:MAG: hypothetical protein KA153_08310 [Hyphomonadaceae bacterium]|nr:hypothetical protein [Hyphomonadaceae bacterium]
MVRLVALALFACFNAFIFHVPSAHAQSAPFCVVSGAGGTQCNYYSRSHCEETARQLDGGCVANSQSGAGTSGAYQPPPYRSADVYGNFQRGVDEGERRRFEQENRNLELERQRLENERLRQQNTSVTTPPPSTIPDGIAVAMDVCIALRDRLLREENYETAQPYIEAFQICMRIVDPHVPKD